MSLLAGDVGGTKVILGIYNYEKEIKQIYKKKYLSKEWQSFDLIIEDFIKSIPSGVKPPEYGCIGIAGRVSPKATKITNLPWIIEKSKICQLTNLRELELINDFSVIVYGIPYLKSFQYKNIQLNSNPEIKRTLGRVAIIGAGTGLGIARGVINNQNIDVFPSEGGHGEFSPRSAKEWELTQWLKEDLKLNRISIERVISGSGLADIVRWRIMQQDCINHPLRRSLEEAKDSSVIIQHFPEIASKAALNGDEKMQEVVNIWLSAYGSAAGDLALQELCNGGLWIAGGTACKHIKGIQSITFLKAFKNKGRFESFLSKIPIIALVDQDIGLFSAGCRAHTIAQLDGKLNSTG